MLGDWAIPYTLMEGYGALVQEQGTGDLYRQSLVQGTGHCEFTAAESTAIVETLVERIETGAWPETSPEALNAAAEALETGSAPGSSNTVIGAWQPITGPGFRQNEPMGNWRCAGSPTGPVAQVIGGPSPTRSGHLWRGQVFPCLDDPCCASWELTRLCRKQSCLRPLWCGLAAGPDEVRGSGPNQNCALSAP